MQPPRGLREASSSSVIVELTVLPLPTGPVKSKIDGEMSAEIVVIATNKQQDCLPIHNHSEESKDFLIICA